MSAKTNCSTSNNNWKASRHINSPDQYSKYFSVGLSVHYTTYLMVLLRRSPRRRRRPPGRSPRRRSGSPRASLPARRTARASVAGRRERRAWRRRAHIYPHRSGGSGAVQREIVGGLQLVQQWRSWRAGVGSPGDDPARGWASLASKIGGIFWIATR